MVVLTTPEGWTFNSQAFVNIKGTYYDMDELTPEQKRWVSTMLNVQGLNAAYAGKRVYRPAEPLPPLEEVFPEFAGSAEGRRIGELRNGGDEKAVAPQAQGVFRGAET